MALINVFNQYNKCGVENTEYIWSIKKIWSRLVIMHTIIYIGRFQWKYVYSLNVTFFSAVWRSECAPEWVQLERGIGHCSHVFLFHPILFRTRPAQSERRCEYFTWIYINWHLFCILSEKVTSLPQSKLTWGTKPSRSLAVYHLLRNIFVNDSRSQRFRTVYERGYIRGLAPPSVRCQLTGI